MKPINYGAINDATVAAGSISIIEPTRRPTDRPGTGRERASRDSVTMLSVHYSICSHIQCDLRHIDVDINRSRYIIYVYGPSNIAVFMN